MINFENLKRIINLPEKYAIFSNQNIAFQAFKTAYKVHIRRIRSGLRSSQRIPLQ